MIISAIIATSRNNCIGDNNQLVWHYKKDLQHFKRLTEGHTVIMGRKTFESIGKPLPNRVNVVLSQSDYKCPGVIVVKSIAEAMRIAMIHHDTNPFIIGGKQIYELAEPYITRFYVTVIDKEYNGDTYFILPSEYEMQVSEDDEENGVKLTFNLYEKRHGRKDINDTKED